MRRLGVLAAVAAVLSCVGWGAAWASGSGSGGWKIQKSPDPGGSEQPNLLAGVAATSATNAWAVGNYLHHGAFRTLVEHWNGKAWKVQKSSNPGRSRGDSVLDGVAASSTTNAWAVGFHDSGRAYPGSGSRTLIEHWNGKAWKAQKTPNPGGAAQTNLLFGVAATSAKNAWAVGCYSKGSSFRTLVEHWNGKAWKAQKTPNPGPSSGTDTLAGVTATSSKNAWAIGSFYNGSVYQTLVEHWNGKAWKVQKTPNPGGPTQTNELAAVTATSAKNAWAVGYHSPALGIFQTLVEHWNGKAWKMQKTPNPGGSTPSDRLAGVTATSANNAWAVGSHSPRGVASRTLVERWNSKAWKLQNSPKHSLFAGVASTSATNAWAVGSYSASTVHKGVLSQTLIARWR